MSILFATPAYGGQLHIECMKSYQDVFHSMSVGAFNYDAYFLWKESYIVRARNRIARIFLETDMDRLMFIDADISFSADDVAKVYEASMKLGDEAVVGGLYRLKKSDPEYCAWTGGQMIKSLQKGDPYKVDKMATGFMMIPRGVFKKIAPLIPHLEYDDEDGKVCHSFFDGGVVDRELLSEDYFFCHLCKIFDVDVYAEPNVMLSHYDGSHPYRNIHV